MIPLQSKLNSSVFKTLSSTIEELNHKISSLGNIQPPSATSSSYASAVSSGKQFATPSNTDTLAQDGKHKMYTVCYLSSMSGRELNLILFGLQETGSIVESKQLLVDEILLFITGRAIPIKDLFRLGKLARPSSGSSGFSSGKLCPVLIKLMTAWDCRVVLYSKRKLKDFRLGYLFLWEERSPEHKDRRQKVGPASGNQSSSAGSKSALVHRGSSVSPLRTLSPVVPTSEKSVCIGRVLALLLHTPLFPLL